MSSYGTLPSTEIEDSSNNDSWTKRLKERKQWIFLFIVLGLLSLSIWLYISTQPNYSESMSLFQRNRNPNQIFISIAGKKSNQMAITWSTAQENRKTNVIFSLNKETLEFCLDKKDTTSCGFEESQEPLDYIQKNNYRSQYIHKLVMSQELIPNQIYYYSIGDFTQDEMSPIYHFRSPKPIQFNTLTNLAIVGDLGQTQVSQHHVEDIQKEKPDAVLALGDLSYADKVGERWDSWAYFMSNVTSTSTPWMVTAGNHEIEKDASIRSSNGYKRVFVDFQTRFRMPFAESNAENGNLYYSFNSGNVHVIMLATYWDFQTTSKQYQFLENDLKQVDRSITPWVVVGMHAPWYNTNVAHQQQFLQKYMQEFLEHLLVQYRVDLVVAGHVHAYEHVLPVFRNELFSCGPHYITTGTGGNRQGLNTQWLSGTSKWTMRRESKYGYATFQTYNHTHAQFSMKQHSSNGVKVWDSFTIDRAGLRPGCQQ